MGPRIPGSTVRLKLKIFVYAEYFWEVNAHPIFDLDCRKKTSRCRSNGDQSVICGFMGEFCSRSCAEDPSDEGTLLVIQ